MKIIRVLLLLFGGVLATGLGLVEAGAVLGFDFVGLGGLGGGFAPQVHRIFVGFVLLGFLSRRVVTDFEPECVLFCF